MIICTKCNKEKPNSDFHKDSRKRNGFCSWCKSCKTGHYHTGKEEYLNKRKEKKWLKLDEKKAINF